MKKTILAIAATALALSGIAGAKTAAADPAAAKGEARLAKMLEGRTAGTPQSCISAYDGNNLQVIDRTAVVYKSGNIIYVARADDPKSLDDDDILIVKRFGSQLCKQDVQHSVDRMSGFLTNVVFLGDFVPYKKG